MEVYVREPKEEIRPTIDESKEYSASIVKLIETSGVNKKNNEYRGIKLAFVIDEIEIKPLPSFVIWLSHDDAGWYLDKSTKEYKMLSDVIGPFETLNEPMVQNTKCKVKLERSGERWFNVISIIKVANTTKKEPPKNESKETPAEAKQSIISEDEF